jgi:hypothetical protein
MLRAATSKHWWCAGDPGFKFKKKTKKNNSKDAGLVLLLCDVVPRVNESAISQVGFTPIHWLRPIITYSNLA